MVVAYIVGSVIIVVGNAGEVPEAIKSILSMAFTKKLPGVYQIHLTE